MTYKRKYTVKTQLHKKNNQEIIDYFEEGVALYNHIKREAFHVYKRDPDFKKHQFNTYLQEKYNILKRTANSIISDAIGNYNTIKELKEYELKQVDGKIEKLKKDIIPKLSLFIKQNLQKMSLGMKIDLKKHRNLRSKLVAKKKKLHRLTERKKQLLYEMTSGDFKICFGTKHLLRRNLVSFRNQRDSQMSFVGCKSETCQNQMLQLFYNPNNNQFDIRLRKDLGGYKDKKNYAYGRVYFNHHKNELIQILKEGYSPLSFKIQKKKGRYYLICTFEIHVEKSAFLTRNSYGTVGVDFNKGFITITETDAYGNMLSTDKRIYRFKQGNKTVNDFRQLANELVKQCLKSGKDLVIENLNFKKTKSKTESKAGKQYNEMIHSLAYKTFTHILEEITFRNYVWLRKVNPAWTSWIAKHKYCPLMKLNVHTGAAYVIARRGQGFKETKIN